MKKCAIIIETAEGKLIVPVENFSKENVINALAKTISVDADKIEQASASPSHGIYGLKEHFKSADRFKTSTAPWFYSDKYFAAFMVHYGYFAE
jgi:hypothetical protein